MRVPEVGRQTGQVALDVDAVAVPSQQRLDCKSMAQVMQTGAAGFPTGRAGRLAGTASRTSTAGPTR